MEEKGKKEEIRVEDRRIFDQNGNVIDREGTKPQEESIQAEPPGESTSHQQEEIDFVSVLLSYVHSALIYLGDLQDPIKHTTSENLEGAQQMIDILEMLHVKTKGNLTQNEQNYLEGALFDLRMRYMKKAKLIK